MHIEVRLYGTGCSTDSFCYKIISEIKRSDLSWCSNTRWLKKLRQIAWNVTIYWGFSSQFPQFWHWYNIQEQQKEQMYKDTRIINITSPHRKLEATPFSNKNVNGWLNHPLHNASQPSTLDSLASWTLDFKKQPSKCKHYI